MGVAMMAVSAIGFASAAILVLRDPAGDGVATDVETRGDLYGQPRPGVSLERLSSEGIPAVLVATSGNEFGISVVDLEGGYRATYRDGAHTAGDRGALSGAVLTAGERLVLWRSDRPAVVYSAARDADGRQQLIDGGLARPGAEVGTILGERTILPTERGDAVWILAVRDGSDRQLELVDLDTGTVRTATTVPPGSRLVGVVGENAVVQPDARELSDGALVVSPSGETTNVVAPEPARLVAMTGTQSVWIAGGDPQSVVGDRLLVVTDGRTTVITPPADGGWVEAGAPTIPSNSPHLATLSADGTRLLLALTDPSDPNRVAACVAVVDLERLSATIVYEGGGSSSAFWALDDRTAVVIDQTGQDQVVKAIDTTTGAVTTSDDAVPPGFFVIAGR
jgi:hypothetical protein